MKFDVHKAGMLGGTALGEFIETIDADDHRTAKTQAETKHGTGRVVVLPHRPTTDRLERALRRIERRRFGARRP
jgi:hypothetical protein